MSFEGSSFRRLLQKLKSRKRRPKSCSESMIKPIGQTYLDLLIRALSGELSDNVLYRNAQLLQAEEGEEVPTLISLQTCRELLGKATQEFGSYLGKGETAESYLNLSPKELFGYLNWMNPIGSPHTMCGADNIYQVEACVEDIFRENIPGDLMETGVWKGGMTVLMRGLLKAYNCHDRLVWVADSFSGLPQPDPKKNLKDAIFWYLMTPLEHLAIPFEYVEALFQRYDLLDDQVRFLPGWFKDTLPAAPIEKLALLRMDGDLYESTRDTLEHMYPKVSKGGYIIVDDYGIPAGCRDAVDEYRRARGIAEPIQKINDVSVFWRKMGV